MFFHSPPPPLFPFPSAGKDFSGDKIKNTKEFYASPPPSPPFVVKEKREIVIPSDSLFFFPPSFTACCDLFDVVTSLEAQRRESVDDNKLKAAEGRSPPSSSLLPGLDEMEQQIVEHLRLLPFFPLPRWRS